MSLYELAKLEKARPHGHHQTSGCSVPRFSPATKPKITSPPLPFPPIYRESLTHSTQIPPENLRGPRERTCAAKWDCFAGQSGLGIRCLPKKSLPAGLFHSPSHKNSSEGTSHSSSKKGWPPSIRAWAWEKSSSIDGNRIHFSKLRMKVGHFCGGLFPRCPHPLSRHSL